MNHLQVTKDNWKFNSCLTTISNHICILDHINKQEKKNKNLRLTLILPSPEEIAKKLKEGPNEVKRSLILGKPILLQNEQMNAQSG